jgi:hypothetical protein
VRDLGIPTGPLQAMNGITFIPMVLMLDTPT